MTFEDEEDIGPSRSARKREAEEQQKLGEALVALPADQLKAIRLDDELREAILLARRITARGGRRRQLQLVGKLMRHAETAIIREDLERLESQSKLTAARHIQAESWREKMLAEGDAAVAEFLVAYPEADVQRLRQLIQAAHREKAADKPARSSRELFRKISSLLDQ